MFKKVLLGLLAAGVIAILVVGAVNRTNSKVSDSTTAGAGRRGGSVAGETLALGQAQLESGQHTPGSGGGRWAQPADRSAQTTTGLTSASTTIAWQTVEGVVAGVASDILTVQTTAGQTIEVEGQPWAYAQQAGFAPRVGDSITLVGYDQAGEFIVGEMTDTSANQNVALRDATGRPAWAGRGQGRNRG